MSAIIIDGVPFYGSFLPPGKKLVRLEAVHTYLTYDRYNIPEGHKIKTAIKKLSICKKQARQELAEKALESGCNAIIDFKEIAPISDDDNGYSFVATVYGCPAYLADDDGS
jgi:hypothetical protein